MESTIPNYYAIGTYIVMLVLCLYGFALYSYVCRAIRQVRYIDVYVVILLTSISLICGSNLYVQLLSYKNPAQAYQLIGSPWWAVRWWGLIVMAAIFIAHRNISIHKYFKGNKEWIKKQQQQSFDMNGFGEDKSHPNRRLDDLPG